MLELTYEIRAELHLNEAFKHVLERCLEEPEFISGFCRIYEVELPHHPHLRRQVLVWSIM